MSRDVLTSSRSIAASIHRADTSAARAANARTWASNAFGTVRDSGVKTGPAFNVGAKPMRRARWRLMSSRR